MKGSFLPKDKNTSSRIPVFALMTAKIQERPVCSGLIPTFSFNFLVDIVSPEAASLPLGS